VLLSEDLAELRATGGQVAPLVGIDVGALHELPAVHVDVLLGQQHVQHSHVEVGKWNDEPDAASTCGHRWVTTLARV